MPLMGETAENWKLESVPMIAVDMLFDYGTYVKELIEEKCVSDGVNLRGTILAA